MMSDLTGFDVLITAVGVLATALIVVLAWPQRLK